MMSSADFFAPFSRYFFLLFRFDIFIIVVKRAGRYFWLSLILLLYSLSYSYFLFGCFVLLPVLKKIIFWLAVMWNDGRVQTLCQNEARRNAAERTFDKINQRLQWDHRGVLKRFLAFSVNQFECSWEAFDEHLFHCAKNGRIERARKCFQENLFCRQWTSENENEKKIVCQCLKPI